MTREEAIDLLDNLIGMIEDNHNSDYDKALKMAIEALKQEPCDDSISRQAVLSMQYRIDDSATLSTRDVVNVDDIEDLPPVIPKLKIGHWIKYGIPRCREQHYQCTSCGYYINFGQWGDLYTKEFKYCPNCGAKMKKEVEE